MGCRIRSIQCRGLRHRHRVTKLLFAWLAQTHGAVLCHALLLAVFSLFLDSARCTSTGAPRFSGRFISQHMCGLVLNDEIIPPASPLCSNSRFPDPWQVLRSSPTLCLSQVFFAKQSIMFSCQSFPYNSIVSKFCVLQTHCRPSCCPLPCCRFRIGVLQ